MTGEGDEALGGDTWAELARTREQEVIEGMTRAFLFWGKTSPKQVSFSSSVGAGASSMAFG